MRAVVNHFQYRIGLVLVMAACVAANGGATAGAEPPALGLPMACPVDWHRCPVQNHVDQDMGPDRRDWRGGHLTYDGTNGTDIRLPSLESMWAGVPVLAAAAGTVLRVRDGEPDLPLGIDVTRTDFGGRTAGNGVLVTHGDGWTTQYAHLLNGSVAVAPGQAVAAGDLIGFVGMSGRTEFPHLEIVVRHGGSVIDPFTGAPPGEDARAPLWTDAAMAVLDQPPGRVLVAGVAISPPTSARTRRDHTPSGPIHPQAPMMIAWAVVSGPSAGDLIGVRLIGPDGVTMVDHGAEVARDRAEEMVFSGRRRPAQSGWTPGIYRIEATLSRTGRVLSSLGRSVTVGASDRTVPE